MSLASKMDEQAQLAQLEFMRTLFAENLPVGDKLEVIEEYFNELEKVICNKQHVEAEQFVDEPAAILDDHTGAPASRTPYKYISPSLLKQYASRDNRPGLLPQNMADSAIPTSQDKCDAKSNTEEFKSLSPIPEHTESGDPDILELIGAFNN